MRSAFRGTWQTVAELGDMELLLHGIGNVRFSVEVTAKSIMTFDQKNKKPVNKLEVAHL